MRDSKINGAPEESGGPATPEDVAILYSWANLPGAKYRDFSASRREYRAQQRARLAEEQRQTELASAQQLEETARREMEEAQRRLEQQQAAAADAEAETRAREAFRLAQAHAVREREEAERRQQSAETLRLRAQAARREMMDARKRAEEQAARYAEFDAQYRAQVEERGQEPPGQLNDPYYYTGQVDPAYFAPTPGVRTSQATRTSTERKAYVYPMHPGSDEFDAGTLQAYRPGTNFAPSPAQTYRSVPSSADLPPMRDEIFERDQPSEQERLTGHDVEDASSAEADNEYYSNSGRGLPQGAVGTVQFQGFDTAERDLHIRPRAPHAVPAETSSEPARTAHRPAPAQWTRTERRSALRDRRGIVADGLARTTRQPRNGELQEAAAPVLGSMRESTVPPAWLTHQEEAAVATSGFVAEAEPSQGLQDEQGHSSFNHAEAQHEAFDGAEDQSDPEGDWLATRSGSTPDTLQQSRERVAARWFALQGMMAPESTPEAVAVQHALLPVPVLAVMSLSGGVGKTSMVATLGRALSSFGEKVLLADANMHGLLPYYFGARDLRPGTVRTFTPPAGSANAPVLMAHYEAERIAHDFAAQDRLLAGLTERAGSAQRVLVDLAPGGLWLARRLAHASLTVLVPLVPDMNSILGTQAMERMFAEIRDAEGRPIRPYYVLNQYDPALPLHLDVREVLRQSVGDRLLPLVISRAAAVSEALAEGMTAIDYAPSSAVAEEYTSLARWIQGLAAPGHPEARGNRWSER